MGAESIVDNPIDDDIRNNCPWILLAADGAETVPQLPKAGVGRGGYPGRHPTNALSLQTVRHNIPGTLAIATVIRLSQCAVINRPFLRQCSQ